MNKTKLIKKHWEASESEIREAWNTLTQEQKRKILEWQKLSLDFIREIHEDIKDEWSVFLFDNLYYRHRLQEAKPIIKEYKLQHENKELLFANIIEWWEE